MSKSLVHEAKSQDGKTPCHLEFPASTAKKRREVKGLGRGSEGRAPTSPTENGTADSAKRGSLEKQKKRSSLQNQGKDSEKEEPKNERRRGWPVKQLPQDGKRPRKKNQRGVPPKLTRRIKGSGNGRPQTNPTQEKKGNQKWGGGVDDFLKNKGSQERANSMGLAENPRN